MPAGDCVPLARLKSNAYWSPEKNLYVGVVLLNDECRVGPYEEVVDRFESGGDLGRWLDDQHHYWLTRIRDHVNVMGLPLF